MLSTHRSTCDIAVLTRNSAGREVAIRLLFTNVFGDSGAVRGLNFLIVLSAFGNLITVLLGDSRAIRECGRQGVIPFTKFWVSTRPFGTTAGPYLLKWFLTIIVILGMCTNHRSQSSNMH